MMKPRSEKNSGGNSSDYSETIPRNGNGYQNNESMSEENDRSRSQSPSRKGLDASKQDHDALSIYIGNVDYTATEEDLRDAFIHCGAIVRVTIIKNMRTGHPKGAGFIEFSDKNAVSKALQLNGKEVRGRALSVTSKKPKPDRSTRGPPVRERNEYRSERRYDDYPPPPPSYRRGGPDRRPPLGPPRGRGYGDPYGGPAHSPSYARHPYPAYGGPPPPHHGHGRGAPPYGYLPPHAYHHHHHHPAMDPRGPPIPHPAASRHYPPEHRVSQRYDPYRRPSGPPHPYYGGETSYGRSGPPPPPSAMHYSKTSSSSAQRDGSFKR